MKLLWLTSTWQLLDGERPVDKQLVETFPDQFEVLATAPENPNQVWIRDETFTRVDLRDQTIYCQPNELTAIGPYLEHAGITRAGVPAHRR